LKILVWFFKVMPTISEATPITSVVLEVSASSFACVSFFFCVEYPAF